MLLLALAAAQLSAPQALNDRSTWFTNEDITPGMLEADGFFYNVFRLTVDPAGVPIACQIVEKSDVRVFDEATCRLAKRRARFKPAMRDGAAAFGVYTSFVRLGASSSGAPNMHKVVLSPNLELIVDRLPSGTIPPATVNIVYALNSAGQPTLCRGEREMDDPALVQLACEGARQKRLGVPVADKRGRPVESVQRAQVRFMTNQLGTK